MVRAGSRVRRGRRPVRPGDLVRARRGRIAQHSGSLQMVRHRGRARRCQRGLTRLGPRVGAEPERIARGTSGRGLVQARNG